MNNEPNWLSAYGLSDDPKGNTGPAFIKRALEMLNGLSSLLGLGLRQIEREHRRMVEAEGRLALLNGLLWRWAEGEHEPGGVVAIDRDELVEYEDDGIRRACKAVDYPPYVEGFDAGSSRQWRQCFIELGTALGEDTSRENVQHMMQKRASERAAAEQGPLCVCLHERALHPDGGPCIGYHALGRGPCDRYDPLQDALAP